KKEKEKRRETPHAEKTSASVSGEVKGEPALAAPPASSVPTVVVDQKEAAPTNGSAHGHHTEEPQPSVVAEAEAPLERKREPSSERKREPSGEWFQQEL